MSSSFDPTALAIVYAELRRRGRARLCGSSMAATDGVQVCQTLHDVTAIDQAQSIAPRPSKEVGQLHSLADLSV